MVVYEVAHRVKCPIFGANLGKKIKQTMSYLQTFVWFIPFFVFRFGGRSYKNITCLFPFLLSTHLQGKMGKSEILKNIKNKQTEHIVKKITQLK
jgi:hypothetical protein